MDSRLNPHEKPPEALRLAFKQLKSSLDEAEGSVKDMLDVANTGLTSLGRIPDHILTTILEKFQGSEESNKSDGVSDALGTIYTSQNMPGLLFLPSLLPPSSQKALLSRLLHRDLSKACHKTNLHSHYRISYPSKHASFFSENKDKMSFEPVNSEVHKPITVESALQKKMRWVTLGGQYDWTNKEYPPGTPPEFPTDVADLLGDLFPDMEPQAAIVNFYSPGDTLSLHRDVSEEVDRGLVSISLGCDAIFIIGLHDQESGVTESMVLRLHSGDALYMSGASRFAWHAVPRIVPNTCPDYLEDWPGDQYPDWKGWMKNKRINLNVRQMREATIKRTKYAFI